MSGSGQTPMGDALDKMTEERNLCIDLIRCFAIERHVDRRNALLRFRTRYSLGDLSGDTGSLGLSVAKKVLDRLEPGSP